MLTLYEGCFSSSLGECNGKRCSCLSRPYYDGIIVYTAIKCDASPDCVAERNGIPSALVCPRLFDLKARIS